MTPADIAAIRAKACRVLAELGAMLLALEDAESFVAPEGLAELEAQGRHLGAVACRVFAHDRLDTATGAAEAAAACLAELVAELDAATQSLAPQGTEPGDRIVIPPDEFSQP